MSGLTPSMSNWVDANSFDVDPDKMMNSFFADASAANMSNTDNNESGEAFASAWPSSVTRTNGDSPFIFGLSPGLTSQYQLGTTKSNSSSGNNYNNIWSLPSDLTATLPASTSGSNGMYPMLADNAVPPSLSNANTLTPSDAQSLRSDMLHPLGTIPTNDVAMDDMVNFPEVAKNGSSSTPQLPLSSFASPAPPLVANTSLTGYHSNIASDHAAHLADLVKSSNITKAGHPGPRSLASSLSRSVLNADSIGRPDASANSASPSNERLTIQQRRRISHMAKSSSNAGPAQAQPDQAHSPVQGRRRQNSAPHPSLPTVGSSPEMPWTPPHKQRRPYLRHAVAAQGDLQTSHSAAIPASDDDVDSWMDAVVAHSHDLVFVLSLKGTVLYMSPSVQRILGYHPEEIVGRPLVDFSHPADIGPFSRELKEAITLPSVDGEGPDAHNATAAKAHRRVDLIMRMACKDGNFSLIETTGRVSVDPPKHRKVVVCSGRPHSVPMLPWNDVRQDLLNVELSAWLKISHNGIFLGSTGPIQRILGIDDINLIGRHVRDLPMVTSSTDLLDALRSGRCISVQDHYEDPTSQHKAPVKLTVYPWTSNGRSNSVSFVHVQQQPADAAGGASVSMQQQDSASSSAPAPTSPAKRKAPDREAESAQQYQHHQPQTSSGSLSGSAFQANGTAVPVMTAGDAANTVFSELTGFHSGSWLIEMQKLHSANRKLRHELSALQKKSSPKHSSSPIAATACS